MKTLFFLDREMSFAGAGGPKPIAVTESGPLSEGDRVEAGRRPYTVTGVVVLPAAGDAPEEQHAQVAPVWDTPEPVGVTTT